MFNKKIKNKISVITIFLSIVVFSSIFLLKTPVYNVISVQPISKENISVINYNKEIKTQIEIEKEKFVTLNVLDQTYKIEIKDGDTVYGAMQTLNNSTNNFSFEKKEYSSLGVFINEINGVKGKSGAYWIYYVNGKEAPVGVSKYILKSGDVITWKQE